MDDYNIMISGLTREYPEYKYSTNEMVDLLGNKLTDNVKENIVQLGVKNRFFIRPFEQYIQSDEKRIKSDGEPISDLCTKTAEKCLQNLGLNKNDITCIVAAFEDNDFLSPGLSSIVLTKLDGTAKGGVVIGISDQFQIPVRYIGVGEGMGDLQNFNKKEFVDSLFN